MLLSPAISPGHLQRNAISCLLSQMYALSLPPLLSWCQGHWREGLKIALIWCAALRGELAASPSTFPPYRRHFSWRVCVCVLGVYVCVLGVYVCVGSGDIIAHRLSQGTEGRWSRGLPLSKPCVVALALVESSREGAGGHGELRPAQQDISPVAGWSRAWWDGHGLSHSRTNNELWLVGLRYSCHKFFQVLMRIVLDVPLDHDFVTDR